MNNLPYIELKNRPPKSLLDVEKTGLAGGQIIPYRKSLGGYNMDLKVSLR